MQHYRTFTNSCTSIVLTMNPDWDSKSLWQKWHQLWIIPKKNLETTHHRNLKTVIHLLSICRSSLGRLNVHTIAYCILRSIKYLLFCHSFINLTAFFLRQRCKTLFLIIWPFLFISVWKKLCKTIFSIVRDASSDIYYC